jgi:MraZ protein
LRCGEKWSKVGLRGRTIPAPSMFYGKHEHTVDEKNRLTLPAKFRDALAAGVVLARGIDRNIDVYPRGSWDASVVRIAELDSLTREAREMKRYVFAGAAVAELDKQGRVIVPPDLLAHAGLGKDVVVAGVHDHIEIWDRSHWADHVSAIEGSVGDVAERTADRRS